MGAGTGPQNFPAGKLLTTWSGCSEDRHIVSRDRADQTEDLLPAAFRELGKESDHITHQQMGISRPSRQTRHLDI